MKGFIKIEAATHEGRDGMYVHTDLKGVSPIDRIQVLHCVCQALHVSAGELKLIAGLIGAGLIDDMTDVEVLEDETEMECAAPTKKKPNIKVIGGDAEDMLELLELLLK